MNRAQGEKWPCSSDPAPVSLPINLTRRKFSVFGISARSSAQRKKITKQNFSFGGRNSKRRVFPVVRCSGDENVEFYGRVGRIVM
jgi:hypothetical protein